MNKSKSIEIYESEYNGDRVQVSLFDDANCVRISTLEDCHMSEAIFRKEDARQFFVDAIALIDAG